MPEKAPAFQFYPKDWLTDNLVLDMTLAERGEYIDALCRDWINDGIPERTFNERSTSVQAAFSEHPTKPGFYTNPRLQREREKQRAKREQQAEAGRKSAKSRACEKQRTLNERSTDVQRTFNSSSSTSSSDEVPPSGGGNAHAREEVACVNAREIPSLEQVQAYFANAGAPADWAQSFFDHYDGLGWMGPGNRPIAKWQSFAGKWISNNRAGRAPGKQAETNGPRGAGTIY